MSSVTQQKSDLRQIIHNKVEKYLDENPGSARDTAMGAIRRLSSKMTLKELKQWHRALFIRDLIPEEGGEEECRPT